MVLSRQSFHRPQKYSDDVGDESSEDKDDDNDNDEDDE